MRSHASSRPRGSADPRLVLAIGVCVAGAIVAAVFLARPGKTVVDSGDAFDPNRTVTRTRSLSDDIAEGAGRFGEPGDGPAQTSATGAGSTTAESGSMRFLGKVSDEDGFAVVGATVGFYCASEPNAERDSVSGNDGRYDLRVPAGLCGDAVRAGWTLGVSAEGFAAAAVRVAEIEPDDAGIHRHDFELVRGGAISGRVTDGDDAPVAAALVGLPNLRPTNASGESESYRLLAVTNEEGAFRIDGVPFDREFVLPAIADGFMRGYSETVAAGESDAAIVLRRGETRLFGRTVDHTGQPVESRVAVRSSGDDGEEPFGDAVWTNVRGEFDFPALPAGTLGVSALRENTGARAAETVELAPGEERELVLAYAAPAIVVGRAIDIAAREGVHGLRIGPLRTSPMEIEFVDSDMTTSDIDGQYRFEVPVTEEGTAWIRFVPPAGWLAADGARTTQLLDSLKPGEERRYDVLLREGAVVSGRVVDSAGAGVSGASVRARGDIRGSNASATSKGGGAFRMTLARGAVVRFSAKAESGEGGIEYVVAKRGEPEEAVIALRDYGSVHGRVTAEGEPVAGATVGATPTGIGGVRGRGVSAQTGADGAYLLESVSPGEAVVSVSVPEDTNYAPPEPQQTTVAPAESAGPVDFELSPGDTVEGVVLARTGEPLADAAILYRVPVASVTGTETRRTASAEDGYFAIGGVPRGLSLTQVTASLDGYHPEERFEVGAGDSPLTMELSPKEDLPLFVYSVTAESPVDTYQWRVFAIPERGVSYAAGSRPWTDSPVTAGRTSISDLDVGMYRIEVREVSGKGEPTGRSGAAEARVHKAVTPSVVTIDVGSGLPLAGIVVADEENSPVAGARIDVLPPKTRTSGPPPEGLALTGGTTQADGTFAIADLSPGEYSVAASSAGQVQFEDVRLAIGEPTEPLRFVLAVVGNVSGVVTAPSGERMSGYSVPWSSNVILPDGTPGTAESGTLEPVTGDRFRIEGLRVGRHVLTATDPDSGRTAELTFPVYSGFENSALNVNFSERVTLRGSVSVNGRAWTGHPPLLMSSRGNDYLALTEPGRYETAVWPGEVALLFRRGARNVRSNETFDLAADPPEQERDFGLELADADVVVIFPEGEEYREGRITLVDIVDPVNNWKVTAMEEVSSTPSMFAPELIPRDYEASYVSLDGEWEGRSEPGRVAIGGENVLVVEARLVDAEMLVGSWTPQTVPREWTTLSFDAMDIVRGGGRYEAIVLHQTGGDGVEIDGGELVVDGTTDSDGHAGWSGLEKRNHVYTFTVPAAARNDARLRLRLRGAGNFDTAGAVYLRREVR